MTTGQLTRQRTEEAALPRRPDSGLASRFLAIAAGQPGHYEELAAARAGTATAVLVIDAIPNWAGRAAAAEDRQSPTGAELAGSKVTDLGDEDVVSSGPAT